MNGRRVTAVLLTAFLVAQIWLRLQAGGALPASSPGVWTQVAKGGYRVTEGGYLVPAASGAVLRRFGGRTAPAHENWSAHLDGTLLSVYGSGRTQIGVAATSQTQEILARYGPGFLFEDRIGNLWSVTPGEVRLLLGGGVGETGRAALQAQVRLLQAEQKVPPSWRLIWVADPIVVGQDVWYLTNRALAPGGKGLEVWSLSDKGTALVPGAPAQGITSLLGSGPQGVMAQDAQGDFLLLDRASGRVTDRMPGTVALAIGEAGQALLLRANASGPPAIYVFSGAATQPTPLMLPRGTQALGPAQFSPDGRWLAMSVRRDGQELLYVVRVKGLGAGKAGELLPPPSGERFAGGPEPSVVSGRVYVVAGSGGHIETWERSIGDGEGSLALGLAHWLALSVRLPGQFPLTLGLTR